MVNLNFPKLNASKRNFVIIFMVGFIFRSIPNLLTQYPIGYDTIDYTTQILDWKNAFQNFNTVFQAPLFILLADCIYLLTNIHPFILLRLFQPVLYGLLVSAFYYAGTNLFRWKSKWEIISALIFAFQTVTLRVSWDLLKNELGLAFLLFALPRLTKPKSVTFVLLTILVVFSHQITSIILLAIIVGLIVRNLQSRNLNGARTLFTTSLPFLILLSIVVGNQSSIVATDIQTQQNSVFNPTIISIPIEKSRPFPFVNYLAGEGLADSQGSYLSIILDVFAFYIASYIFILPLLFKGMAFIKNDSIRIWTIVCTYPILNCIFLPGFALLSWHRWVLMLIVPYSFFAVSGLKRLNERNQNISFYFRTHLPLLILALFLTTSILYMVMPHSNPISLYDFLNPSSKYSPTTMMRNTLPQEDIPNVMTTSIWLTNKLDPSSCLLVKDAFLDWMKIFLEKNITIINYRNKDVDVGLSLALSLNFTDVYWIWWDNGVGLQWYGQKVPDLFYKVYQCNTLSIYKYEN